MKTWLPEDVKKQEAVSNSLVDLFVKNDFEPIEIPTIVDMSVVEKANSKFSADVFKLVDKDGTTLALRTELTQPIARTVAARSKNIELPIKLYYNSKVYRFQASSTDASREIKQAGVEIFGEAEGKTDLSLVRLVLDSVDELKLEQDTKLNLTHASIWQRIFELYGNEAMDFEQEMQSLMNSGSYKAIVPRPEELDKLSLAAKAYKFLLESNLVAFRELVEEGHPLSLLLESKTVEDFEKAFELDLSIVKDAIAIDERVKFNPLQCPDLKLYTGLHLNLFLAGQGKVVALGGRYDNLCNGFGANIPAIGFAFYLPGLISSIEKKSAKRTLKIALAKGGLLGGAQEYLAEKGLKFEKQDRKLILPVGCPSDKQALFDEIEVLLVRGHDVPVYVQHGAADLGVVGSDVVLDSKVNVMQLEDLGYGKCFLAVCAKNDKYKSTADMPRDTRVATTFPNLAKDYFQAAGINAEVINLYGSVELGPLTQLSDVIVDLVATGKTLNENGLEVVDRIMDCSARLIANPASFSLYRDELEKLLD